MTRVTRELIISNPTGLHARPAGLFAEVARSFESELALVKDGKSANCRSLIAILKLGITQGSSVRIIAEGSDAEEATIKLTSILEELGGEGS